TFAPQTIPGTYTLVFGAQILDAGGTPLDQDQDGLPGEAPDDYMTVAFPVSVDAGTDPAGYRYAPVAYDPTLNLSPTAAAVAAITFANPDDSAAAVGLGGGNFVFYGTAYNQVFVSTNGTVALGSAFADYTNTDLLTGPSQALIAPFWDDLHTGRNTVTDDLVL